MSDAVEEEDEPSLARRALHAFTIALRLLLVLVVVLLNLRLHGDLAASYREGAVGADARSSLASVRAALDAGAASNLDAALPEGAFTLHVIYGLASLDLAALLPADHPERALWIKEARFALQSISSAEGMAPFAANAGDRGAFGVLYWSQRTFLEGRLLFVAGGEADLDLKETFELDAAFLASLYVEDASPFPERYLGQAWPSDSVVAMAALALHDTLLPARYEELRARWLERSAPLTDPETGLLPHRVYPGTGALADGTRASSQLVALRYMPWVSPERAQEAFGTFRERFVTRRLGLPAVREYPSGVDGAGDVDSGPLLLGASVPSTTAAIGVANIYGDYSLSESLITLAEFFGLPFDRGGQKSYLLGFVPLGDARLAWSKLSQAARPPGFEPAPIGSFAPPGASPHYALIVHGICLLLFAPLLLSPLLRWRARRREEAL